jgi:hypothetical protein
MLKKILILMEGDPERGFVCCKVVMCAVVSGWGRGREMERVREGGFVCCNVVMCAVVSGWGRGREMERVREREN